MTRWVISLGIVVMLGLVPRAAHAAPWLDFLDTFDALATGQTIGTAMPGTWTDTQAQGVGAGLWVAPAPGGGHALTDNPDPDLLDGTKSRSDRRFGALDAATATYAFAFRAFAGAPEATVDLWFKQENVNGYTFRLGLDDGDILFSGNDSPGGAFDPHDVKVPVADFGVWYEFVAIYTVAGGQVNDTIAAGFRKAGDPGFTPLGTLFSRNHDLFTNAADANQVLAFITPSTIAPSYLDDLSGSAVTTGVPEPATVALMLLGVVAAIRKR